MEKYHYSPEEYPNLKRLAGEMIPCLETEAGWQDREIQETFPGRDQSFLAVGITLGKGIDALQEKYLQNGFLTESYMIEVLSSELLLKSYQAYTEWLVVHRDLHVARLHFLGGEISETSEQKISSLLRLANLPMLLQELALPVTCNAAYWRTSEPLMMRLSNFTFLVLPVTLVGCLMTPSNLQFFTWMSYTFSTLFPPMMSTP